MKYRWVVPTPADVNWHGMPKRLARDYDRLLASMLIFAVSGMEYPDIDKWVEE